MKTLLCVGDDDNWCLCPYGHKCWNVETDDYVSLNCLVWCEPDIYGRGDACNCEFLLCLKGRNSDPPYVNEYDLLIDGKPGDMAGRQ